MIHPFRVLAPSSLATAAHMYAQSRSIRHPLPSRPTHTTSDPTPDGTQEQPAAAASPSPPSPSPTPPSPKADAKPEPKEAASDEEQPDAAAPTGFEWGQTF